MSRPNHYAVSSIPTLWLGVFFLLPFIILFVISFSVIARAQPPYEPVFSYVDGLLQININFENWVRLFTDSKYITTYLNSVFVAFVATFCTLIIGFPVAYTIARANEKYRNLLLLAVILPFWTSFLLRVYALKTIFYNQGPINALLQAVGLTDAPIQFLNTDFMVFLGITYVYLPFMVLPLYANLTKLQEETLEASRDLGASPFWTFWQIVVPLALPGIIAGSLLVFIPAVGEYVIPEMLGGPGTKMIGKLLYVEYFGNLDWPMASALAIAMLFLVVAPFLWVRRWQDRVEAQYDA